MSLELRGQVVLGSGNFVALGTPRATMGLGATPGEAREILERAAELGITAVDTAHSYAAGDAARLVGTWSAGRPDSSVRPVIVGKFGAFDLGDRLALDLAPQTVHRCVDDLLEWLQTDTISVLMPHAPDHQSFPPRVTVSAIYEEIERGRVADWGVSNVEPQELEGWINAADALGVAGPALVENSYNLLDREAEAEVLPICRDQDIGFLAYSPLASGVLTGKYVRGQAPPHGSMGQARPEVLPPLDESTFATIDRLTEFAHRHGTTPGAAAIGWLIQSRGVWPICGPKRPVHMDVVADSLQLDLPEEEWAELAESTGPITGR